MNKILTIIIPTYNMEKYLDKCLTSLILSDAQLMMLLEVLVVIDGAKDSSSEIAHRYAERHPETFCVIDKENGNYGSCINRGLKEAKGKYIKVLDADDYFETEVFEEYLKLLSATNVDAVLNGFDKVLPDGNITESIRYQFPEKESIPFSRMLEVSNRMWMHAVTFNTEKLRKIGYKQTEGISYTDQEWVFLPMTTVSTFEYINKPLYKYLVGRDGQTVNADVWEKNFWMEIKGVQVMLDEYYKQISITPTANEYLLARLVDRSRTIYIAYLYKFKSQADRKQVYEFDATLKRQYHDIYERIVMPDKGFRHNVTGLIIRMFRVRVPRSVIRVLSRIIQATL